MHPKTSTLHHRLRHFADHIVNEEMRIYHEAGINIPYRWHSILQLFAEHPKPLTISQIAEIQEKTHPDVVYTINQMAKAGLVEEHADKSDKRKRIIQPSTSALKMIEELKLTWLAVQNASLTWINEIAPDLLHNLEALSNSQENMSFYLRIRSEKKKIDLKNVSIVAYQDIREPQVILQGYWNQFKSKYFEVDEIGDFILNMKSYISKNEGYTFFVTWKKQIIGCASMLRRSFHFSEIVFIYLDEEYRRRYIASKLLSHVIKMGKEIGASQIMAQVHPKLVAVNALFKQSGFVAYDQIPKSIKKFKEMQVVMVKDLH